jgi:hypothetical protein
MAKTSKISKKAALKQIEKKLRITFSPLEPVLGNKDFKKRLKNAGKALIKGLKNKESQLALANLKQIKLSTNGNIAHKKTPIQNLTPQVVPAQKRKIADVNH